MAETPSLTSILNTIKGKLDSAIADSNNHSEFTNNIPDVTAQRNLRILKSIDRSSNTGITTVVTEKPHNLITGDQVQLRNVKSGANSNGTLNSGYNIVTDVVGITSSKGFELKFVDTDPGTYSAHTARDNNLPVVARW